MAVSDLDWSELDDLRQLKEDHLREIKRLRASMKRAKNGIGGTLRHFEAEGNAIGQAMMEGVYLDLEETLAGSHLEAKS
jgi:hypothetical protein